MTVSPRILVIGAMDREINGLRRVLEARPASHLLEAYPRWFSADGTIAIVQTHVGDVDAAIASTAALAAHRPAAVIKLGCVGGHTAGIHTGDVVIPGRIFHSGAWIARSAEAMHWQPIFGDLPYQVNRENLGGREAVLAVDEALTNQWARHIASRSMHGVSTHCVHAHIGSSNMWFFDRAHMMHVLDANLPTEPLREWVADMESYAVARACSIAGVRFTGIYRAANSEYHGEPYVPSTVATLFDGDFMQCAIEFLHSLC